MPPSSSSTSSSFATPPLPSMASTSSPASSSSKPTRRLSANGSSGPSRSQHASDVFRPRFPIDPFGGSAPALDSLPWIVDADRLPSLAADGARADVVFVLNAPSAQSVIPLLTSDQFRHSLLILASAGPLDLSQYALTPAVRVLLLPPTLAQADQGALQLVRVLEWAARVARAWRSRGGGGSGTVAELSHEDDDGVEELPPKPSFFSLRGSRSIPGSPAASYASLSAPDSVRPRSFSARLFSRPTILPAPSHSARPIDGFVHFLSKTIAPKQVLKQIILASTISAPFLSAQAVSKSLGNTRPGGINRSGRRMSSFIPPGSVSSLQLSQTSVPASPMGAGHRDSFFPTPSPSTSTSTLALPRAAPSARSHILHVVPAKADPRMIISAESFLATFGLQPDAPAPYVLMAPTLLERVRSTASHRTMPAAGSSSFASKASPILEEPDDDYEPELFPSVAEALLWGALDASERGQNSPNVLTGNSNGKSAMQMPPRAYLPGPALVRTRGSSRSGSSTPGSMTPGSFTTTASGASTPSISGPSTPTSRATSLPPGAGPPALGALGSSGPSSYYREHRKSAVGSGMGLGIADMTPPPTPPSHSLRNSVEMQVEVPGVDESMNLPLATPTGASATSHSSHFGSVARTPPSSEESTVSLPVSKDAKVDRKGTFSKSKWKFWKSGGAGGSTRNGAVVVR